MTEESRTAPAATPSPGAAGVQPDPGRGDLARQLTVAISAVIAIGGSLLPLAEFRSIETLFGADTVTIAFRVELGASSTITKVAGTSVVTVGDLADLPRLVRRVRP